MSPSKKLFSLLILISLCKTQFSQEVREVNRFSFKEVTQAVAVDKRYFYVINSSTISKHKKNDGELVAEWNGAALGIKHLNSGVIIKGRLFCATSNYPDSPMASSIEIFNAKSLKHIDSHSFGIYSGSATWIDRRKGYWFIGFAHYSGKGSSEGKGSSWTTVSKFKKNWQLIESWIFPKNVIEQFMPMSNSGASWDNGGRLYCTGHDKPEIYVLELPRAGFTLKYLYTIKTRNYGQGIAFDRTVRKKKIYYGISRHENSVIISEIN